MYLKALHVVGFKSFADKTQVQFHPGITAIVGPNGCGKSNVLDAIRWVLGEQSAKALRGGQMQDVIFGGADTRKPLGMAEVALTFGDCEHELGTEFNEVTITRRLFRDGASEYEINKNPCRLRDIQQLFMDTGVGRTAYSIMEQGKIDQILSARPEDRRAVFEEAAGITKFKSQKKEALRKLEHTETNLLRLEDIIREVRRQIGSLQRQASKAKRYQELFAELKTQELKYAHHQYTILAAEILALQERSESAQSSHQQLSLMVEGEDQALGQMRNELEACEFSVAQVREALSQTQMQAERAVQREKTNVARVEEFSQLREHCRIEIAGTEEKLRIQDEQLQSLTAQLEAQSAARSAAETTYRTNEQAVRTLGEQISEKEAEAADRNHELLRLQSNLSNLRNQKIALEAQQRNLVLRSEALQAEQTLLTQRREEADARCAAQAAELDAAERALTTAREQLAAAQHEVGSENERSRQAEHAHRDLATAQGRLQAKADALRQLEESHAGSPPATQHLLGCSARGEITSRLQGTLSDHLQISAGYESAFALLLGEAINALVIDDQNAAHELLRAVAEKGEGQVFLAPLSLARPSGFANESETAARRFVQVPQNEAVAGLIDALLADAHVVDHLDAAWQLKAAQPQAIVATRDGLLLNRAGLIQAGKTSGAPLAVLTRRTERRELEEQLSSASTIAESAAQAATEAAASLRAAQEKLQTIQATVQAAEITAATSRHAQQTLRQAVSECDAAQQRAAQESARVTSQIENDANRFAEIERTLTAGESEIATLQESVVTLRDEATALHQEEASLRQTLVESQIELATLTHQHQATEQQQGSVRQRLSELRELASTRTREADDYAARITQAESEIASAQAEQQTAQTASAEQTTALQAALAAKSEQQEKIAQREDALRVERRKLAEAQSIQSECEIKLTERRLTLGHLTDRVQQTYQVALAEMEVVAPAADEPETDWTALEAEVAEKRQRLDGMGPVNLEAIAEFEELQERLTFLETQEADLRNGKDQLLKAIDEINQTTQKMFAETFEQVKINFQAIFSELFGGGKASLVLVDENDPLESGIEIVARPPGKQPQSITLLSGGEKTMTAVALLFAIYMVKPSPFCVLDEMDAPLDESNINRFIKMVQRFTEHSQFVVITHNKRTISMADAIFGVTMQERGVSRLMSVKLTADGEPVAASTPVVQAKENGTHSRLTPEASSEEPALSAN